jgi:hypothetical protein
MTTLKQVLDAAPELAAMTYPEASAWLAECPMVENPVKAAPLVPAPVDFREIMGLVPDAEAGACYDMDGFIGHVEKAAELQDRLWLAKLLGIAVARGAITQATAAKLQPMLVAQVADPSWRAQVPGTPRWQAAGLAGAPSAADVQAACHG